MAASASLQGRINAVPGSGRWPAQALFARLRHSSLVADEEQIAAAGGLGLPR